MNVAERQFGRQVALAALMLTAVVVPIFALFNGVEAASGGWTTLRLAFWRVPGQLFGLGPLIFALAGAVVALRWRRTGEALAISLTGRSPIYLALMSGVAALLASVCLAGALESSRSHWPTEAAWRSGVVVDEVLWVGPDAETVVVLRAGTPVGLGTVRSGATSGWAWRGSKVQPLQANASVATAQAGSSDSLWALFQGEVWPLIWQRTLWPFWAAAWSLAGAALGLLKGLRGAAAAVLACGGAQLVLSYTTLAASAGQYGLAPLAGTWILCFALVFSTLPVLHRGGVSLRA